MDSGTRVLIAPLDWGLGHASRCIPIIHALVEKGASPLICGSGESLALLKREFPDQDFRDLPNYPISYPSSGNLTAHFLRSFLKMRRFVDREHELLLEILEEEDVQAIISDNRYGIFHDSIPSVIITHQLSPLTGLFRKWTDGFIAKLINRFHQCWIPDLPGLASITGDLSKSEKVRIAKHHIGLLSRFQPAVGQVEKEYEIIAIISGPETQRTVFEKKLVDQLRNIPGKHVLIRGSLSKTNIEYPENLLVFDIGDSLETEQCIDKSRFIVCRSGYSSIMDLFIKKRCALIIPTPGQKEQEYLAEQLVDSGQFLVQSQHEMNLSNALDASEFLIPGVDPGSPTLLDDCVEGLLTSVF